jgi:hypothetical protein
MPIRRRAVAAEPGDPSPAALRVAAEHLALGDSPALAAAAAQLSRAALLEHQANDPGFAELLADLRRILTMDQETWLARLQGRLRLAAERLLDAGDTSFVNQAARLTEAFSLERGGRTAPPSTLEEGRLLLDVLAGMAPEQVLDYVLGHQRRFEVGPAERAAWLRGWQEAAARRTGLPQPPPVANDNRTADTATAERGGPPGPWAAAPPGDLVGAAGHALHREATIGPTDDAPS